jgi:hypothetical protein
MRNAAALPRREDIDLAKLRSEIANLFIIERSAGPSGFRWRLSGTGISEIFRRDQTGRPVLDGWDRFERSIIERFLNGVAEELQPCVLRFRFHTDGGHLIGTELLALPVAARTGGVHVFGGLFSFRDTALLNYGRIAAMELSGARGVWSEHLPREESTKPTASFRPFQVISGGKNG